jgi:hypothetical protein
MRIPVRTLLAAAMFLGGLSVWQPDADAGGYKLRRAYGYAPAVPPRCYRGRDSVCQENARFFDPTGLYRGFPCWARSAFGGGPGTGR